MRPRIERAAVLGAGVMGSQIAAHLANAGTSVILLDIVPRELTADERAQGLTLESPQVRNRIVRQALEQTKRLKPAAFFDESLAELITTGNFEDHLELLKTADWVIEAVVENLDIKKSLYRRIEPHLKPEAIVTTNTSGIPIARLAEGFSPDRRRLFFGTHFFNPPRYMKLLEVIPTAETSPDAVARIADFCDRFLGKGIVYCKDTPNFIANRIGTFSLMCCLKVMLEEGYTIEEVDALTGPLIGHPKTASFRTADLAGIDTLVYVVENLYANVPEDEKRHLFVVPDFIKEMVKRGWLGNKTGQGFYKKDRATGDILVLDPATLEYRPQQRPKFPSVDMARSIEDTGARLKALLEAKDRAATFIWRTMSETLLYTARRLPEIADDIVQVDRAMTWGFNWDLGPFETWDAIGVAELAQRMEAEGQSLPDVITDVLRTEEKRFYLKRDGRRYFFDYKTGAYREEEERPGVILLASLKERNRVVLKNPGATLIDLGDGVACLEFHTKMNAIGGDTIEMMRSALVKVEREFEGLVIGNQGGNFSAGANIMLMLMAAQEGEWDEIDRMIRAFQTANMSLRYWPKPVVAAPFGLTLGGGCEVVMHADRVCAAAESYIGLVETGVGLIPGGGGTKELLLRWTDRAPKGDSVDLLPFVKPVFETIGRARVSTSALEARRLGFLRPADIIVMNKDRLIDAAKRTVQALVLEGYQPPRPRTDIPVMGEAGYAALKLAIHLAVRAGYITEYDGHVGRKLAWVLSGGDVKSPRLVSEQDLLDLEREAFLSLLGERKTQERLAYMLKEGKPLRN